MPFIQYDLDGSRDGVFAFGRAFEPKIGGLTKKQASTCFLFFLKNVKKLAFYSTV